MSTEDPPTAYELAQAARSPFYRFKPPADFHYPTGGKQHPPAPYEEPPTWQEVLTERGEAPEKDEKEPIEVRPEWSAPQEVT